MDPPFVPKKLREAYLPGVLPPHGLWTIKNQSLHLTYYAHIPKQEFKEWFRNVIMPNYCRKGKLEFLELAHETADTMDTCDHTHVVIVTSGAPIRSGDTSILHWKKMPHEARDPSHLHAGVRILKTQAQIKEAKYYLGDEDPQNAHCHKQYPYPVKMIRQKDIRPKHPICFVLPVQEDPLYKVENLIRWQLDILEVMNANSSITRPLPIDDSEEDVVDDSLPLSLPIEGLFSRRIVNVVLDFNGHAGKLSLCKALKHEEPDRFLIIEGLPRSKALINCIGDAKRSKWTDDAIIINTKYQRTHEELDRFIGDIVSITNATECCNLWIFTNIVPKLTGIAPEYWRFYNISADWSKGLVSVLRRMSYEQAVLERIRQERCISMNSELPRRQYPQDD